ncbi:hypothetical protein EGT74_14875 [Chitinophaga lutea]|uniref:DUF6630 domain-containing protein n=1 Tax=Chitinophaga lutea TaxID=2488634 RepID=A0A3N4Q9E1_9BACT|nr:hypothetical protein [Chitinophaga lutea]RPE08334.1 hypothetical protein EGT74_14875 [Chitinophaga lutea]
MTAEIVTEENVTRILDKLLDTQTFSTESRIPGLKGSVIAGSSYLDAYHTEESLDFKKHGFDSADAFLTWLLGQCGATTFAREHLLVVYYPENTTGELSKHLKWLTIPFYFAFTDKGMHILQSTRHSYIDIIEEMKALRPLENVPEADQAKATQQLADALLSLGRRLRLPFAAGSAPKKAPSEEKLIKELTALLLKPDAKTAKELKTITAEAVAELRTGSGDDEDDNDGENSRAIRGLTLLQHVPVAHADWKFSAADMESYLEEITGQEMKLDLPRPDILSSDLFPYAQQAMAGNGWTLLSYDTGGDSYMFFAVYTADADRVIRLFEQLGLPAEICK